MVAVRFPKRKVVLPHS